MSTLYARKGGTYFLEICSNNDTPGHSQPLPYIMLLIKLHYFRKTLIITIEDSRIFSNFFIPVGEFSSTVWIEGGFL
jgi:hypothetical protein